MTKVKLNDGDGHWIDSDGELITTVWTSEGWKDLPGMYETHSEFLPVPTTHDWRNDPLATGIDDSLNLTIVIETGEPLTNRWVPDEQRQFFRIKTSRFINVNSADFDEVEHE